MILRFWQNKWQKRLIPKDDPSPPLSFLPSQISTKTIILGSETVIGKPGTVTIRPSARRQGWETVNTCSISSTLPQHTLTTSTYKTKDPLIPVHPQFFYCCVFQLWSWRTPNNTTFGCFLNQKDLNQLTSSLVETPKLEMGMSEKRTYPNYVSLTSRYVIMSLKVLLSKKLFKLYSSTTHCSQ